MKENVQEGRSSSSTSTCCCAVSSSTSIFSSFNCRRRSRSCRSRSRSCARTFFTFLALLFTFLLYAGFLNGRGAFAYDSCSLRVYHSKKMDQWVMQSFRRGCGDCGEHTGACGVDAPESALLAPTFFPLDPLGGLDIFRQIYSKVER